jgi:anti-sigma regulatory factor (Ser/Thr protein kinase)
MTIDADQIAKGVDHLVHFYDRDDDLVPIAGRFLADGALAGEVVVMIATEGHRRAFEAQLEAAGIDLAHALLTQRVVSLDAASLLSRILTDGTIDGRRFESVVGSLMTRTAASGRNIRAFGEMVALLWEDGNVMAAIELETLWNGLTSDVSFSLLCAYPNHCVSAPADADARRHVSHLHTAVIGAGSHSVGKVGAHRDDSADEARHFPAALRSARAARRFVVDALRRRGQDDAVVDDAALIVTELATNAIVHARSPFTVTLASDGDVVRIAVADTASGLPVERSADPTAQSGRGLGLIGGVARSWGTTLTPDGKSVWAELAP